ncbi:MAG: hypothetical protein FJZ98_07295 [Chloroflexi bacterium]|nr:hypothetical protein [Chloroflexota bacterium]
MYISIGIVIIDDIVLPDGQTRMGCLGGGCVHAAMGMRVWSDQVGLIARFGQDFPAELKNHLQAVLNINGCSIYPAPTARAWQLFETDGTRREVFRTDMDDFWKMDIRPSDFPKEYPPIQGIHLHSPVREVVGWTRFLRSRENSFILWEPWDFDFVPANLSEIRRLMPLVDVISPNLKESRDLIGEESPARLLRSYLDWGAPRVVIRMGADGSLYGDQTGTVLRIPCVPVERIVDVTGAGNAYCGGFIVGWDQTGDPLEAACRAAVSASFALGQFGAVFTLEGVNARARQRLSIMHASLGKDENHSLI